jgi:hypothetical protein
MTAASIWREDEANIEALVSRLDRLVAATDSDRSKRNVNLKVPERHHV